MVTGPAKIGVVGHPISQSLSPIIHHRWMAELGIAGQYEAIDGESLGFIETIHACRNAGFLGMNITVPYKREVLTVADCATDRAKLIGAANLLVFGEDGILADNTDAEGFRLALLNSAWAMRTGSARVLGAGGAAPAILAALLELGFERIELTNRTPTSASDLATHFDNVITLDWAARDQDLGNVDLVVNTTSLGMKGMPDLEFECAGLPAHAAVIDIVTTPRETLFLRRARALNLFALNGIPMLVYQAVPSFFAWFGRSPRRPAHMIDHLEQNDLVPPKMLKLALTGGIGMGKTTTAALFAEHDIPVWDADAAVHQLYGAGAKGAKAVLKHFPDANDGEGGVDRKRLAMLLADDQGRWDLLNRTIHPLVAEDRHEFIANAKKAKKRAVLCDIPLLFETSGAGAFDYSILCTADEEIRKARVLSRPGITIEKYAAITARQMTDAEKRDQADFIVETDQGEAHARAQVETILRSILGTKSVHESL